MNESEKRCRGCGSTCGVTFEFSSDYLCKSCKDNIKKEIEKCEAWEVKKKEVLNNYLDNQKEAWNIISLDGNFYFSSCQECGSFVKKMNSYGDEKELEHECQIEGQSTHASNQIKSNQIKSNQIKSNQIKSNQIKSNQIKSSCRQWSQF